MRCVSYDVDITLLAPINRKKNLWLGVAQARQSRFFLYHVHWKKDRADFVLAFYKGDENYPGIYSCGLCGSRQQAETSNKDIDAAKRMVEVLKDFVR